MDGGGESKGSGSGKGCQPSGGKGIRYLQGHFSLTSALLQPYFHLTSAILHFSVSPTPAASGAEVKLAEGRSMTEVKWEYG